MTTTRRHNYNNRSNNNSDSSQSTPSTEAIQVSDRWRDPLELTHSRGGSAGWQDQMEWGIDCHKHMFDHQLSCDVHLVVVSADQRDMVDRVRIGAHSYMLAARSEVFRAMLDNGERLEKGKSIEVKDVDERTLKDVIR